MYIRGADWRLSPFESGKSNLGLDKIVMLGANPNPDDQRHLQQIIFIINAKINPQCLVRVYMGISPKTHYQWGWY